MDNSPVHKSKEFIENFRQWAARGLFVRFLPTYSPELNLIEILWRKIKYAWMPFSA
jgi:transposase